MKFITTQKHLVTCLGHITQFFKHLMKFHFVFTQERERKQTRIWKRYKKASTNLFDQF